MCRFGNKASGGSLAPHRRCRLSKTDQYAHFCLFAFNHSAQIADHLNADILAAFHRDDNQAVAIRAVLKHHPSVNSSVRPLFFLSIPSGAKSPRCPPLKLMLVAAREIARTREICRAANNLIRVRINTTACKAALNERNRIMCYVDSDPLALKYFRSFDGRAAAAEWIKHNVALIGGCADDPVQERERLLRRIADALFSSRVEPQVGICPNVLKRKAAKLVHWDFQPGPSGSGVNDLSLSFQFEHVFVGIAPHAPLGRHVAFPLVLTRWTAAIRRGQISLSIELAVLVFFKIVSIVKVGVGLFVNLVPNRCVTLVVIKNTVVNPAISLRVVVRTGSLSNDFVPPAAVAENGIHNEF